MNARHRNWPKHGAQAALSCVATIVPVVDDCADADPPAKLRAITVAFRLARRAHDEHVGSGEDLAAEVIEISATIGRRRRAATQAATTSSPSARDPAGRWR